MNRAASAATSVRSSGPPSTRNAKGRAASHSAAYIVGLRVVPMRTHPCPRASSRPIGGRIHGATSAAGGADVSAVLDAVLAALDPPDTDDVTLLGLGRTKDPLPPTTRKLAAGPYRGPNSNYTKKR